MPCISKSSSTISSHHTDLCLGIDASNELMMTYKTSDPSCLWSWHDGALVNKAGKAMDLEGGSKYTGMLKMLESEIRNILCTGARVVGFPHHGGTNQQWKQKGAHIFSAHSGHVLDIMDHDRNVGAKVKMWTLNVPHSNNQMWTFEYST